jgi:hypothetical protein
MVDATAGAQANPLPSNNEEIGAIYMGDSMALVLRFQVLTKRPSAWHRPSWIAGAFVLAAIQVAAIRATAVE